MIIYLHNQKGLSTLLAIIGMTMLSICIAGLLPFVSSLIQVNSANYNSLQAQYAAEAGAKRAIVSLARNAIYDTDNNWSWLTQKRNLTSENDSACYSVTMMKKDNATGNFSAYLPPNDSKIPDGTYRIISVGTFNSNGKPSTCTVYVTGTIMGTLDFKSLNWSK